MIKTAESLEGVYTNNLINKCEMNKIDKNRQEYCVCIKSTEEYCRLFVVQKYMIKIILKN